MYLQLTSQVAFLKHFLHFPVSLSLQCSNYSWTTCDTLFHILWKSAVLTQKNPNYQASCIFFSTHIENQSLNTVWLGSHDISYSLQLLIILLSFHDNYLRVISCLSTHTHTTLRPLLSKREEVILQRKLTILSLVSRISGIAEAEAKPQDINKWNMLSCKTPIPYLVLLSK